MGPAFTVYYHTGKTGFSSFYRKVNVGAVTPASTWLIANSLPYNSSLATDTDNDGVTRLTAYALDLDPNLNPSGNLPLPVMTDGTLKLSFFAGAEGVAYKVEASTDLKNGVSKAWFWALQTRKVGGLPPTQPINRQLTCGWSRATENGLHR